MNLARTEAGTNEKEANNLMTEIVGEDRVRAICTNFSAIELSHVAVGNA